MVIPSRKFLMVRNIIAQRKKQRPNKYDEEKPKDPEAIERIKKLWLESQKKKEVKKW